jgi:hypothetical protein
MPQAFDLNGYTIPNVFNGQDYGVGQVVAYTGTAGTTTNPITGTLASATITTSGVAPTDTDTVTINGKVYTFKTALTPAGGEVLINVTAAAALTNLIRAVNHTGTPGTDYANLGIGLVQHPDVLADAALTGGNTILTLRSFRSETGANITLAKSAVTLTLSGAVFSGGAVDRGYRFVSIMLTTAGYIKIGPHSTSAVPTATAADIPMAAGVPQVFAIRAGDHVSAVQASAGGNLTAIELF